MSHRLAALALALCTAALCGCEFDDHTIGRISQPKDFFDRAPVESRRAVAKFVITGFDLPGSRATRYFDSNFYALHDEWSWFRLLNGQSVRGMPFSPVQGEHFSTIREIYDWAQGRSRLPLDLAWVDEGRLYSPTFYNVGLFQRPITLGLGSLMHLEAAGDQPERWVFFLEYVDHPAHEDLVVFFEELKKTLPANIGDQLLWAVRSPVQEALAQTMEAQGLAYFDRIIRFKDLAVPGEVEVYNGGLTAGRLLEVRAGEDFSQAQPNDVLMVEQVPDYLPPTAGILSAEPQTPLAHVNILAKNRRIPNAYWGGVLDNAELHELAEVRAPLLVFAESPAKLTVKAITEGQYATYRRLFSAPPVSVAQVDLATLPYTYDLTLRSLSEIDALRPAIGGKAAGFLALLAGAPASTPDKPLAVSIRAYAEHLTVLRPTIAAMLAHPAFQGSVRARYLALEGTDAYATFYGSPDDQRYGADFLVVHADDVLGQLATSGGLVGRIQAQPMDAATLATITQALRQQYPSYAATQALRFRSSSTAEDIEGFNGAGLYVSNTGFLDASVQPKPSDRARTVETALKETWSSYWRAEAFEERQLEGIEHLSGNMGVAVHARHDDAAELANGVFLFTLEPPQSADEAGLELNVQPGATSVTNPVPGSGALPEVDRVVRSRAGALRVERVRASNLMPEGEVVLSDEKLLALYSNARAVADKWLAQANSTVPAERQSRTLVLDFEIREVADNFPAGTNLPRRVLLKQVRSVEPGSRKVPDAVRLLAIPRDVLGRARRVERHVCESAALTVRVVEANTDPLLAPDVGYSVTPFTAEVEVTFGADAPTLGHLAGEVLKFNHLSVAQVDHSAPPAAWSVSLTLTAAGAQQVNLSGVQISADGLVQLSNGSASLGFAGVACHSDVLYSTPQEYLRSLL